jgi:hypothetical protein
MPKVNLTKKQIAALLIVTAQTPSGFPFSKHVAAARAALEKEMAKVTPANDSKKEKPVKLLGRKQMTKLVTGLIRKEEIGHVTTQEFLEAVEMRTQAAIAAGQHKEPVKVVKTA